MSYQIEYFNSSAKASFDAWPMALRARYVALLARMVDYGPDLGMPHTRAMGECLFELPAKELKIARDRLKEIKP